MITDVESGASVNLYYARSIQNVHSSLRSGHRPVTSKLLNTMNEEILHVDFREDHNSPYISLWLGQKS